MPSLPSTGASGKQPLVTPTKPKPRKKPKTQAETSTRSTFVDEKGSIFVDDEAEEAVDNDFHPSDVSEVFDEEPADASTCTITIQYSYGGHLGADAHDIVYDPDMCGTEITKDILQKFRLPQDLTLKYVLRHVGPLGAVDVGPFGDIILHAC